MVENVVADGAENLSLDHAESACSNDDHVDFVLFCRADDRLTGAVLGGPDDDLAVLWWGIPRF